MAEVEKRIGAQPALPAMIESLLVGLSSDPHSRVVSLVFRKDRHEFSLRATGVDNLRVHEFTEQNIVDEVRVLARDADAQDIRDLLAGLLYDKAEASELDEPGFIEATEASTRAVLDGRKVLLEITPIYGASVLLLASSVEWLGDLPELSPA
jgi:hypothetical protein